MSCLPDESEWEKYYVERDIYNSDIVKAHSYENIISLPFSPRVVHSLPRSYLNWFISNRNLCEESSISPLLFFFSSSSSSTIIIATTTDSIEWRKIVFNFSPAERSTMSSTDCDLPVIIRLCKRHIHTQRVRESAMEISQRVIHINMKISFYLAARSTCTYCINKMSRNKERNIIE